MTTPMFTSSTSDGRARIANCSEDRKIEILIEQARLRGEWEDDPSLIYEKDGDYTYAADYEMVSLKGIKKDVAYYKKKRKEILAIRERNKERSEKITKLERELWRYEK